MPYLLEFAHQFRYLSLKGGIWMPVYLSVGDALVKCEAKIDTGSEFCVFQRAMADKLGLNVESGYRMSLDSPGGTVETFCHEVVLHTFDLSFASIVCFVSNPDFPRNLLGRNGWLTQLKLGIVDYEETLYLSSYEPSQL
jgi:hypothetical protein